MPLDLQPVLDLEPIDSEPAHPAFTGEIPEVGGGIPPQLNEADIALIRSKSKLGEEIAGTMAESEMVGRTARIFEPNLPRNLLAPTTDEFLRTAEEFKAITPPGMQPWVQSPFRPPTKLEDLNPDTRESLSAGQALSGTVADLSSADQLLILGGAAATGGVPGAAGRILGAAAPATFGVEGVKSIAQGAATLLDDTATPEQRGEAKTQIGIGLTMLPGLGKLREKPTPKVARTEPISDPAAAKLAGEEPTRVVAGQEVKNPSLPPEQLKVEAETVNRPAAEIPLPEKGLGGARVGEIQEGTGLKNAIGELERIGHGLEEAAPTEKRAMGTAWEQAGKRVEANKNAGEELAASLKENPERGITDEDSALLLRHKVELLNAKNSAAERTFTAETPEAKVEAEAAFDKYSKELEDLLDAVKARGSQWGREGRWRQALAFEDFSLETMARDRAKAMDRPLSVEERAEVKVLHDRITELDRRITEGERQVAEADSLRVANEELQRTLKERDENAPSPYILKLAERIRTDLHSAADAARARIAANPISFGSGSGLEHLPNIRDFAIIGADHLYSSGLDFAKWSAKMVGEFSDKITPHLESIFAESQKVAEGITSKKVPKEIAEKIRNIAARADDKPAIIEGLTEASKDGFAEGELSKYVKALAKHHVEQGVTTLEDVVKAVRADLEPVLGEMTDRQVRDAFSDYGKSTPATTDATKIKLSQLRGEAQKTSALADVVEKNQAPLATGPRRVPQAEETRRLTKKIHEELKKRGIQVTDPVRQLSTALQTIKTRLDNAIADIRFEISTRSRIVKQKGVTPSDAEVVTKRAELSELRRQRDEMFPKEPMSDEARLKIAERNAENNEAMWNDRLARARKGDFGEEPVKPEMRSAKIDAIKARAEAAAAEVDHLKATNEAFQETKRAKQQTEELGKIDARIDEAVRKINEGDVATKPASEKPVIPELEAKRAELAELNKVINKLRAAEKGKSPAEREAQQLQNLQKRADELARQINEGDISVKPRPTPLTSPEKAALRAEIAELNKIKQQLRNAEKPKRTPEEIALKSAHTRTLHNIADLQDRVARGDFLTPRKTPSKVVPDERLNKLRAENEQWKQQYREGNFRARQALRPIHKKIIDGIRQTFRAGVNIVSAFDFSAPRQAAGALLAAVPSPSRWAGTSRAFRDMFKAWSSESRARLIEQNIKNRPNAKNGLDTQAKIEYSSLDNTSFTRWEENARSVLDDWAQLPLKTGNAAKSVVTAPGKLVARGVRMSNRAFITFLNKTRADLFDALLEVNFSDTAPTKAQLETTGNLVNVMTGRGKLNPKAQAIASSVLWSPKLLASRIQAIFGQPFFKAGLDAKAQKMVAKEYVRAIVGGYLLWNAGKLFSDNNEIETDLTSSDAGKIRRGDTRIDPWGGYQQVTVAAARNILGKETSLKGETKPLRGDDVPYGKSQLATNLRFLRTKLRPDVGLAVDIFLANGENVIGEEVTPASAVESITVPLTFRELIPLAKEHGMTEAALMSALNAFGAGVSNYETEKQK